MKFDDVLSIMKSHKKSEEGHHLGIDYDDYSKTDEKEYSYFEGHKRGHKHERHGK